MEIDKVFSNDVDGVADNLFSAVKNSVSEIKAMQQRKAAENVQLVIQALKKIESDLQDKFDGVTTVIEKRVSSIKDGRDGLDGRNGRDGKDGRPGRDGAPGARGAMGVPGTNGRDGEDGVSVTDARIDFDGSLIISLSSGREINVGEVVAPDLAEKIKVITNGGGTSQSVLDSLASLQAQITALSNLGAVNYVGTWNASTNSPTITGGSGDKGDYYVVSVAGSTSIDGQTLWGVGDWIIFNGTAWQKVDGGSTGDFTNLTASGTVTLSGGTANGVAYLNGSKVLTTGSALTFDGTNLGLNCAATNFGANYRTIEAKGASTTTSGVFRASSSDASQKIDLFIDAGVGTLRTDSNHPLAFSLNNAEQMRLTSTGLGIGTSSPATKLDVQISGGRFQVYPAVTATGVRLLSVNTGNSAAVPMEISGTDIRFTNSSNTLVGIFDTSGNLGLGVTPSAWSTGKALELGFLGNALWGNAADEVIVSQNAYYNSGWKYATSRKATHYSQYDAQHRWFTAPSGTAGNAISWTQAMTLDASGNLLVGTTANAGGAARIGVLFAGNAANGINIQDSTTTSGSEFIAFWNSGGTKIGYISRNGTTDAVLYNTTSDERLKENIIDAPEFGGVIDLIKVRSYDWKSDHTHQRAGFIAQELITIAPEAVHQPKNPEEMMAVDYSKLVPMLVKEIQSLRARVAQLEGNQP